MAIREYQMNINYEKQNKMSVQCHLPLLQEQQRPKVTSYIMQS